MTRYILQRLISLIPVLLVVAVVVFSLVHLSPGDPAAVILGPDASQSDIEELRENLGLNLPLYQQFISWLGGVVQGDLGTSIFMQKPVLEVFGNYFLPTLSLSILAQVIAIVIAIPLGIISAIRRGSVVDQTFMGFALFGISVPSFLLGLFLMLVFSVQLQWFPVAGYQPLSDGLWNHLKYLILPAASLGLMQAALIARMTRSSMLEILNNPYIKTARSKGLKERIVIIKHALRNAFIPILETIGQTFTTLIAGAVVVETVFNIPGIGQLIVNSVERRDFPIIQGTVLIIAFGYVLINLIIDLIYGIINPRVRLNRK